MPRLGVQPEESWFVSWLKSRGRRKRKLIPHLKEILKSSSQAANNNDSGFLIRWKNCKHLKHFSGNSNNVWSLSWQFLEALCYRKGNTLLCWIKRNKLDMPFTTSLSVLTVVGDKQPSPECAAGKGGYRGHPRFQLEQEGEWMWKTWLTSGKRGHSGSVSRAGEEWEIVTKVIFVPLPVGRSDCEGWETIWKWRTFWGNW